MYEDCAGCEGCPQELNERTLDLGYEFGGFVLPIIKGLGGVLVVGDAAEAAELRRGEVFSGMGRAIRVDTDFRAAADQWGKECS